MTYLKCCAALVATLLVSNTPIPQDAVGAGGDVVMIATIPDLPEPEPKPLAVNVSSRQVDCLASAMWHEARGEPVRGQVAVAEVVMARTRDGRWPDKPCSVIAQRSQFSFVKGGRIPSVPDADAKRMRSLVRDVLAGRRSSGIGAATYFHAARVSPGWRMKRVATIGSHVFYGSGKGI